ncbi:MAG: hypothetical protein KKF62_03600, partial [Bacteroidetes bacterium]|nr:hypothetical protein [Bacteroidota bacterium]MBU1798968.1 hypothetical protein [Bacteroidota bacterium]
MTTKLKIITLILFVGLILNTNVWGYTTVSSDITTGTAVWSGTIYIFNDITVNTGATLIISAGTVIKFNTDAKITVKGYIYAVGTSGSKIYFTSKFSGLGERVATGFTAPGDWGRVEVNGVGEATSVSRGIFKYCDFEYGGDIGYALYFNEPNATNSSVSYCNFKNNYHGNNLEITQADFTEDIEYNTFDNPTGYYEGAKISQSTIAKFFSNTITVNNTSSSDAYFYFYYNYIGADATWAHNSLIKLLGATEIVALKTLTITGPSSRVLFSSRVGSESSDGKITGSGHFTFDNGELIIQSVAGISSGTTAGAIRNSGARTLSTTSKYSLLTPDNGGGAQVTGSGFPTSVGVLEVNNSQNVTLTNGMTISGALKMISGNIVTNSNTLTLGTSTSTLGVLERTSGTIVGNFRRWFAANTVENVNFPIGTATNYLPVDIDWTSAPSTGGTLTASFIASDPGENGLPLTVSSVNVTQCASDGYWSVISTGISGGTYSIDLTADGFAGITDFTKLYMLKRANSGTNWSNSGTHVTTSGDNTTPVLHRTGMSGFSEFGVGSTDANPLPVELTSFTANLVDGKVELNWETATEVNNYGFDVETLRATSDEWQTIGFVQGSGNSNSPKNYTFVDENPLPDSVEYRLKQIDTDGNYSYYSETVKVAGFGIMDVNDNTLPTEYKLSQNYP